MTTQVDKPVLEDEDTILAFTHGERKKILRKMTTDKDTGEFTLPEDPAEKKAVISVLKDMDAAALGRKRIKVDEKAVDAGAGAAALIAKVLEAAAGARPYAAQTPVRREVPMLGSEVPPPPMVEGETAVVGSASESYETFTKRTNGIDIAMPGSSTDSR